MSAKKHQFVLLSILVSLIISSCDPTITITNPKDGSSVPMNTTIIISADANASEGSIKGVRFFINDIAKHAVSTFPYNYEWNTTGMNTGGYNIKAIAYDSIGQSSSHEININIVSYSNSEGPIAKFDAKQQTIKTGERVDFVDLSNQSPTSWFWDFGDSFTSTEQHPSHIYSKAGVFTVSLKVKNSSGSFTETKSNYITVTSVSSPDYSSFKDPRNGRVYKTVKIGEQTWMAENLNYYTSSGSWVYNDYDQNQSDYGRLYDWKTACNVCPSGWRLPFDDDWKILINHLGGRSISGGKMKAVTNKWFEPNAKATNMSGFSALPAGYRRLEGSYHYLGILTNFWSYSKTNYGAWNVQIDKDNGHIVRNTGAFDFAYSVRCIKR